MKIRLNSKHFHVKFVQTDRRTKVTQYAPNLLIRGHKKSWLQIICARGLTAFATIPPPPPKAFRIVAVTTYKIMQGHQNLDQI